MSLSFEIIRVGKNRQRITFFAFWLKKLKILQAALGGNNLKAVEVEPKVKFSSTFQGSRGDFLT